LLLSLFLKLDNILAADYISKAKEKLLTLAPPWLADYLRSQRIQFAAVLERKKKKKSTKLTRQHLEQKEARSKAVLASKEVTKEVAGKKETITKAGKARQQVAVKASRSSSKSKRTSVESGDVPIIQGASSGNRAREFVI
jgi:hypothetical protein